jgi:hypothetical protein
MGKAVAMRWGRLRGFPIVELPWPQFRPAMDSAKVLKWLTESAHLDAA